MITEVVVGDGELRRDADLRLLGNERADVLVFVRPNGVKGFLISSDCFERKGQKSLQIRKILGRVTVVLDRIGK